MKTLLIDDQRNLDVDAVARDYFEGIQQLKKSQWDVLYLDHDLGCFHPETGRELTGYDVICWLEANPRYVPRTIKLVTSNPVGRSRMLQVIERIYCNLQLDISLSVRNQPA